MTTVEDIAGAWKDAFPEGIDSVEIVRCNRNGWDYDDYIRLRDMGVEPDDIAGIADLLNAAADRERALRVENDALRDDNQFLKEVMDEWEPGTIEKALRDEVARLRGKCNRLIEAFHYLYRHINERDGEIKAFAWAIREDAGLHIDDLTPEPHDAASDTEGE